MAVIKVTLATSEDLLPKYDHGPTSIILGRNLVKQNWKRSKKGGTYKSNIRNIGRSSAEAGSRSDIDHSGKKSGQTEKD